MAGGTFGTALTNDLQYKKMIGEEYPLIAMDQDFQFVKIAGAKKVENNISGQNQNLTIDGNILILTSPDDCTYSSINNDDKYDELFIFNNSTGDKIFICTHENSPKNGFFKPHVNDFIQTDASPYITIGSYETVTFKRVNGVWHVKSYGSAVTTQEGMVGHYTYAAITLGGPLYGGVLNAYHDAILSLSTRSLVLYGGGGTFEDTNIKFEAEHLYRTTTNAANEKVDYKIYDESNLLEATVDKAGLMSIDDKKYVDKGKELSYITDTSINYPADGNTLRISTSKRKWQASGSFSYNTYHSNIPNATDTKNGLLLPDDFKKLQALAGKKVVYGDIKLSADSANVVNLEGNYIDYNTADYPVFPFKVGITLPLANENYTGAISKEFFVKLRDLYTKQEIDGLLSVVYKPKGSVANIDALYAVANPRVGDVYNVLTDGKNYVFVGVDQFPDSNGWDSLAGIIDMTNYYTKTEANNTFLAKTGGTLTGELSQVMNGNTFKVYSPNGSYTQYETSGGYGHFFNKNVYVKGSIFMGPDWNWKVWSSGNDGSGSGLDADLLDGLEAIAFPLANGTRATGTWGISVTGNAATATKFAASKTLWGQTFDGSGNVSGAISGTGHVTPAATGVSDIGSASLKYRNIYGNLVGNVTGTVTGGITGNAATATKLATARTISLTGNASGSASFDGSANINIATTVNSAAKLTTARTIALTGAATGSASFDGSGNISISTAVLFANVGSKPTTLAGYGITDAYTKVQSDATYPVKNENPAQDLNNINGFGIMCNPANANATSARHYPIEQAGTLFYGTGAYGSACQIYGSFNDNRWFVRGGGSSATAKTAWRELIHTGNYTSWVPTKTGSGASGTWGISVTGNAATASKLATARNIALSGKVTGSANFDGSGNISISTSIAEATTAASGLMSAADKTKINKSVQSSNATVLDIQSVSALPSNPVATTLYIVV